MSEEWKRIPLCPYEVSSLGNVRRRGAKENLKLTRHRTGYLQVQLALGARGLVRTCLVHILVAEAFLGRCPLGKEVDHIDGNRANPVATNLQYLTRSENKLKSIAMGITIMPRGEKHWKAKLSEPDVIQIRRLNLEGVGQHEIARRYSIKQSTVWRILNKQSWRHI